MVWGLGTLMVHAEFSCQCLRRNGDTVYVDYLRQFSGEKAPRAAPGTARRNADADGAICETPGGGAADGGGRKGRWATAGGSKVLSA